MSWGEAGLLTTLVGLIEFIGALIIAGYVLGSVIILFKPVIPDRLRAARLHLVQGVLLALDFKVAATLLKTLVLQSWMQLAAFAAVFGLRTILKRLFVWEASKLAGFSNAKAPWPQ